MDKALPFRVLQPSQAVVLCSPVQKSSVEPLSPPGPSLSKALSAALESIPAPDSLPVAAHVFSPHIPEALIRARVLSSYNWFMFSAVLCPLVATVFKARIKCNLALHILTHPAPLYGLGLVLLRLGLFGGFLPYFF